MKAEALYRVRIKEFEKIGKADCQIPGQCDYSPDQNEKAIIFAACILAEAIRNEFDDTEKVVVPEIKP